MLTFSALIIFIYSYNTDSVLTHIQQEEEAVVLVFGCRTYGMVPGQTLKGRLDKALNILEDNTAAVCIVSGGRGSNETVAEAVAMKNYLAGRGINRERIFIEDKSHNTAENLKYIKQLLDANELNDRNIICVSSIYHLPRIRMMAERNNISVTTVPSDIHNVFFTFSDTVREYMAWVKAIIFNKY